MLFIDWGFIISCLENVVNFAIVGVLGALVIVVSLIVLALLIKALVALYNVLTGKGN